MKVTLEEYVLTSGDCGIYQKFLAMMSSLTICMHTFCLTLEVFTALTPTCTFSETDRTCPSTCKLQTICRPHWCPWEWDNAELSIISEFGLICKDAYKGRVVSSYAFLGYTVGCLFWGWLGDKIGRVPSLHICQFFNSLLLYLTSISPSYEWYCLARILTGFTACHWNTACVFSSEWGGRNNRNFTLITHILYSSIGFALFGTIAYFIRPWRQLVATLSIFGGVVFLILLPSLKESPRWLFCKGRKKEAVKNIQFAARMNGLPIVPVDDIENDIVLNESSTITGPEGVTLLLKQPRMVFITITFYLTTLANVLIYYMLKFNAENMSSSPYLSCWLLSLADLPSAAIIYFCSDLSRRFVNFWVQFIAVVFCFLCCISQIRLASAVLCMAFAAVSFNFVYVYLAEVYPTTMRNRVTACCLAVGEIGGMVSNPLVMTNEVWDILPFLVAAVVAIGPTIASWWLPETKGRSLPDNFLDTLNIVYTPEELPMMGLPVVKTWSSRDQPVTSTSVTSRDERLFQSSSRGNIGNSIERRVWGSEEEYDEVCENQYVENIDSPVL